MLSTYCQSCGSKNEYKIKKPKFCGHCGEPFGTALAPAGPETVKKKRSKASREPVELDEDGTDVFEVPDLSDLEYEISYDQSSFTLGSLMGQREVTNSEPAAKRKRGRPRKTKTTNAKKKKS